jgi:outer membrane murein-binding lipoprotein Lpp
MASSGALRRGRVNAYFFILAVAVLLASGRMVRAQDDTGASPVPELAQAMRQVEEATAALKQASLQATEQTARALRERHDIAQRHMEEALGRIAGVPPQDIAAMHQVGMQWGQIARELGLDPGLLGLGPHEQEGPLAPRMQERERARKETREQLEATVRQMKERGAPKHGMAAMTSGSKGLGLGMAKDTASSRSSRGFAGQSHTGGAFGGPGGGQGQGAGPGGGAGGGGGGAGGGSGGGGAGGGGGGGGGGGK